MPAPDRPTFVPAGDAGNRSFCRWRGPGPEDVLHPDDVFPEGVMTSATAACTHHLPLTDAPHGHHIVKHEEDRCGTVVLRP